LARTSEFDLHDEFPDRAMVGRIYRTDTLGEGPRARTSVEFDALDERHLELGDNLRGLFLSDNVKPFGLVRVLTTISRFAQVIGREPVEGEWYRFQLLPRPVAMAKRFTDKLTAWHVQLTDRGYTQRSRGYIIGAEFLQRDGERPLKSLGAAVPLTQTQRQAAIAAAQFPNFKPANNGIVATLLQSFGAVETVQVHDVGQANFLTMYDAADKPIVHFDAGWPIGFNGETAPKDPPLCHKVPVILSHWDWDHLSGYYRFGDLQSVKWVTPVQYLGFGAGRVATRLDNKGLLHGYSGPVLNAGSLTLGVCNGPANNKNQTGLALRVALPPKATNGAGPRAVLLTGDADYDHVPATLRASPLHALLVTHHGANFEGSVPVGPAGSGRAIVSVGRGNRYKHPKAAALKLHNSANWRCQMTMYWAAIPRGPRWFT
jgi:competence protein ComEC